MAQIAPPTVEVVDRKGHAILLRVNTTSGYIPIYRHFLVGQDSNLTTIPFVTQVHKHITTVPEAFDSLMPKAVKEAVAKGLKVKRQGDWFFIPSPPPQGPSCHLSWQKEYQDPRSPLKVWVDRFQYGALYHLYLSEAPTRHTVRASPEFGIPEGSQVVYRENGHHYVRGIVEAPDHERLHLQDWHTAHRAKSGPWGRPGRMPRGGD